MSDDTTVVTRTFELPGLQGQAEIVVDLWGIPHIRASSRHDLFYAQGFNAARDRLWQLDLWRKRGLGLMAADHGPGFLAQDRAARLFLYRGEMAAEWDAYGVADAREVTEAFVSGLNAFITLTEARPELLPAEFAAMRNRPAHWLADDVVRIRSHALVRNVLAEALRAQVAARAGLDVDLARAGLSEPGRTTIPDGLRVEDVPLDLMDVFLLATAPVSFTAERLSATLAEAERWTKVSELGAVIRDIDDQGFNNWVVAPSHSATGRAIAASDPHRAHGLPSLRYIVHLTGAGIDVIGAGEPALPGVSFGHNEHAAFSMTFFPADQSDIVVYETKPGDPTRYRYGDSWEDMTLITETIAVRGELPQPVELRFTRHGPVIYEDRERHLAYAIRSVWFEAGGSAYFASLAFLQAKDVKGFEEALRSWSVPPGNWLYADTAGEIAWIVAGRMPRRPNWDGLLPVPGDGRYEWDGFHDPAQLPRRFNPSCGFIATANEMTLPADYPNSERKLSFEWLETSRATRINEVLRAQGPHSVARSMALQTDALSIPARRIMRCLESADATGDAAQALQALRGWDLHLSRDSGPAALFEVWWMRHLKPALLDRLAADPVVRRLLSPGDTESLLAILERGQDVALLLQTLAAAWATCRTLLGDDSATWRWGALHQAVFGHPLAAVAPEAARDVGPLPKAGSGSTVMATTYRAADFRITAGSSFRMVADVGAWDNSRAINAPGQSGNPSSPHYDDLAPLWADGSYVPLLFSREAVDAAAEQRIRLVTGRA